MTFYDDEAVGQLRATTPGTRPRMTRAEFVEALHAQAIGEAVFTSPVRRPHPFDPSYTHPDRCVVCRQPQGHPNHT